jgi:magnesium-transporting ATPase (P-type)
MFVWAEARGLPIEEARTIVVNTIVVMEIFYLFSVRYLYTAALTWTGLLGTPAVLTGVSATAGAQLLFTYVPFMQQMFATRPVSILDAGSILMVGIVLFAVLEFEKLVRRRVRLP